MKTIDFYFDFGSPNCYFAYKTLPAVALAHGAEINLIPCLLGGVFKTTGNVSPMQRFSGVKGRLEYEFLEMDRFAQKHGLTAFTLNPHFPINTLALMRGLVSYEDPGERERYIAVMLTALWETGENLNDNAVIRSVLEHGGFDPAAFEDAIASQPVKDKLMSLTNTAIERGVFGLPTFFVGDEMYFGKERLAQISELLSESAP